MYTHRNQTLDLLIILEILQTPEFPTGKMGFCDVMTQTRHMIGGESFA